MDDDPAVLHSLCALLKGSGLSTRAYPSAMELIADADADALAGGCVVMDVRMPGMDGMAFLKRLMGLDSGLPVIMITGHGDVPMAVEAMRLGAMDFMEKPFNPDRMTELVKKASQARRMTLDNRALRRDLSEGQQVMSKLVGASPAMDRLREDILDLGQADDVVGRRRQADPGGAELAQDLPADLVLDLPDAPGVDEEAQGHLEPVVGEPPVHRRVE